VRRSSGDSQRSCNRRIRKGDGASPTSGGLAGAGRAGQLYTGHCVIRLMDNTIVYRDDETSITTVYFATPSDADLEAYLATGESLRVAGGFTLDGLGGWFINGVDGDPSAVVGIGLPLMRLLISRAGLSIAALWAANPVTYGR